MTASPEREDDNPSRTRGSSRFNAKASARLLSLVILVGLIAWAGGFVFVFRVFGLGSAMLLSLVLAFPLIVAVRMRRRWPAVRGAEFVLLSILSAVASGGGAFVVWDWFDKGMDQDHAAYLKYAKLGRRLSMDPAFRHVEAHLAGRRGIYWVSGEVASKADLDRLIALARQCGITGPIDGPYAQSVSVTVQHLE